MFTVAGIDASLTSTGIAIIGEQDHISLHRVRSSGKKDDTLQMRNARLHKLAGQILDIVVGAGAELVVIEAPTYATASGHMHDRSGLWWLVVRGLQTYAGIPVIEASNTIRAKYATGKGSGPSASKDAVLTAVVKRYPDVDVKGNDQADALLLAAIGRRLLDAPIEDSLPQTHLDAMKTLRLPD